MLFKCAVFLLPMLCGHFAHELRVVFQGSAAAPVKTRTAILPGRGCSVVWLRSVVQDAMRPVFIVWSEVKIKVYADDRRPHVQTCTMS